MVENSVGNTIGILGLGVTGISVARYFEKVQQPFVALDTRESISNKNEFLAMEQCKEIHLGTIDTKVIHRLSQLVVSPGISLENKIVKEAVTFNIEVIGDVELFLRNIDKPVVAITGSNGKSTVTDLINRLLKAAGKNSAMGGNIGIPVLDFLPEDLPEIYVLELSSFQLDCISSLKAKVGILLNVCEDHMDRYQTYDDYVNSKISIVNGAEMVLAWGEQPEFTTSNKLLNLKNVKWFGEPTTSSRHFEFELIDNQDQTVAKMESGNKYSLEKLSINGRHNQLNAVVALATLENFDIEISNDVLESLNNYSGLSHRFQIVESNKRITWINDSKATNVGATISALNNLNKSDDEIIILIAGGDAKGADLSELACPIKEKVSHLLLMGKDAEQFSTAVNHDNTHFVTSMKSAVQLCCELIEQSLDGKKSRAIVLLSPACASIDMFANFEQRGNEFATAVVEACA